MNKRWMGVCGWAVVFLALTQGCASIGSKAVPWDGDVKVHGALRAMMHQGQTGAMVGLDEVTPNPDLYAVGALADLAGEITIVGGKVFLSWSEGADAARNKEFSKSDTGAALLVSATVSDWVSMTTERAIRFEEIDDAIAGLAAETGMDLDARFPFLLHGVFEDLRWHVIDGEKLEGGGSSHQDHLAAAAQLSLDHGRATLIGFYSKSDQGVFTHMGSTTHMHCVIDKPLGSGHVDHVVIPTGTVIEFPVR